MILSVIFLAIAIISSLGSTQSQQGQDQPETSYNACGQGPSGIPGVPGTAGHNGLPGRDGRDGLRGDKGEAGLSIKGDKGDIGLGQIGLPGPQGLRGEKGDQGLQGIGLPGKTGPRGHVGSRGEAGLHGFKGEKGIPGQDGTVGLKGQKGQCGTGRKSAFTAIKSSTQDGNTNDVVTFQRISANVNDHFNLATSKFNCVYPGTYVFTFTIGIYQPRDMNIQLVHNGNSIVLAHTRTVTGDKGSTRDFDTSSSTAILNLQPGDQVWLKFATSAGQVYGSDTSNFSGFLLYEN